MKFCRLLCTVTILFCISASFVFGAEPKKHTVQKGETFYSISKKYSLTVKELLELNNLSENTILKAGDTLIVEKVTATVAVPKTKPYTVTKGDTLYSIARTNGTTVAELQKLNGLDTSTALKVGQVLMVPQEGGTPGAVAVAPVTSQVQEPELLTLKKSEEDVRPYDSKVKGDITLIWPVKATEVAYVNGKISGVSITASAKSEKVTAIRAGKVMSCSTYRGFGQVVFIQASTGHIYVYSGLDTVTVKVGQNVAYGDTLGTCGTDALSGKDSISLMVYQNGKVLDPAKAPRG